MGRHVMDRIGLSLVLLSAVAVAAAAQEPRPTERARERAFTFSFGPEDLQFAARRGRLGIMVDLTRDVARDSIGARVAGVTPGGPADRAGVRTDDIVVRLNGTRLVGGGAGGHADDEQSPPGLRLIELASRLDAGDTVRLDLRRDNRPLTLTFQAGESDMDVVVRRFRDGVSGALPLMRDFAITPQGEGRLNIRVGGRLTDLELVRVNPGLAEYFGTSEGILVVDAPSDSSLGLRAGDVIISIGGRRPTSPAHALRILSTYDAGENVSFEIYRSKRRATVNGRMPSRRDGTVRYFRNSFEVPSGLFEGWPVSPEIEALPSVPGLERMQPDLLKGAAPRIRITRPQGERGQIIIWT